MQIHDLPKPSYFNRSIGDLDIGTYDNIEVAHNETPIIEALNKFVNFRISALPIVDDEHKLIDIYAKFDVIVSIDFDNLFNALDLVNFAQLSPNLSTESPFLTMRSETTYTYYMS